MRVAAPESAKPLYAELQRAVWRAGGHVIGAYQPDDDARDATSRATSTSSPDEAQLDFFPARYMRGLVDEMDHQVVGARRQRPARAGGGRPGADHAPRRGACKPLLDWRTEKENAGRFSWTLGLYGTPAMAAEAGMSEEEYWQQIIHACFLDEEDPIARWREVGGARSTTT